MKKVKIHSIKNYYLRKRHGCGCCDAYSLYYYLAKQILPCLKVFKRQRMGHPIKISDDREVENRLKGLKPIK